MKLLCKSERLPFTAVYMVSMLGTLYACLIMRSYFMVILFSAVQVRDYICDEVQRAIDVVVCGIISSVYHNTKALVRSSLIF
jgi:hypothetical protein